MMNDKSNQYNLKQYTYYFYYHNNELYAYTDNKKYAKNFETSRNMTTYFKKRKDIISAHEVNELADEYQQGYLILSPYEEIPTVITVKENTVIEYVISSFIYQLSTCTWIDSIVFKEKIQESLNYLSYDIMHDFIEGEKDITELSNEHFKIDPFSVFYLHFGDTLRE